MMPRNLVVHQGALGDWVLVIPMLRGLYGVTAVVTAGEKARLAARMIAGIEAVDIESRDFTRLHAASLANRAVPAPVEHQKRLASQSRESKFPLGGRLEAIDGWIVSFVSDGCDAWAENVRRLAPAARLAFARPRPPAGWREHVTRWHAAQLAEQGLRWREVEVPRRDNPRGPVVIHPGSGGAAKCWPRERFERVMETLRSRGLGVYTICGEVELETWPADDRIRWEQTWNLRALSTLDDLAATISQARLFLGNDSGPTHLAAQLGVPTLALFGPTEPAVWSPLGPAVKILAPPSPRGMDWLDASRVIDAVWAAI